MQYFLHPHITVANCLQIFTNVHPYLPNHVALYVRISPPIPWPPLVFPLIFAASLQLMRNLWPAPMMEQCECGTSYDAQKSSFLEVHVHAAVFAQEQWIDSLVGLWVSATCVEASKETSANIFNRACTRFEANWYGLSPFSHILAMPLLKDILCSA